MNEPLNPLQDILRYAYERHGIEYSSALVACIELASERTIGADFAKYGDSAQCGMDKLCTQLLSED